MLRDFIAEHRVDILARASRRVARRNAPVATEEEVTQGLPVFLDQLRESLRRASSREEVDHSEIQRSAGEHGDALFHRGATVAQVVHDYGDLCQVITGLAVESGAPIATEEFQTLNLCLDDAIAGAVGRFSEQRERAISSEGTERLGILAHEMRNDLPKQSPPADAIEGTPKAPLNGGPPGTKKAGAMSRVWARLMPMAR